MFEQNFTAEQIDRELQRKGSPSFSDSNINHQLSNNKLTSNLDEPVLEYLGSLLEKTSSLLENQVLFRAEIDSLRQELTNLRQEKSKVEVEYLDKISALEKDLENLRAEKAEIIKAILDEARSEAGHKKEIQPSKAFLSLPLVIRNSRDEFLGLGGKAERFSLEAFLNLIENNEQGQKEVRLHWSKEGPCWILEIFLTNKNTTERHQHLLELRQVVTPNHNNVIEVTSMLCDSKPVPREILLALCRKIKENLKQN